MDLVNELSSDVAFALLSEDRLLAKLDRKDAKTLISRLQTELQKLSAETDAHSNVSQPAHLSH